MKKSLSLLVAIALVFGMFASAAFAADNTQATQDQGQQAPAAQAAPTLTSDQKYQELLDAKVLKGNPDGNPRLADKLTRAEFVTIAVEIGGLQPVEGNSFSDTKGHWASGAIEAAVKAGLVNGMGDGKFAPKANVRIEEVIKVAALLAGLKPVDGAKVAGSDDWAGPYIQAAIDAGLISATQFSDYTADATRAQAIDVAYPAWKALQGPTVKEAKVVDANNVEVTFSDGSVEKVKLDTALEPNKETEITVTHNGKEYKVKVTYVVTTATKVESVTATNLKEVVVKFDGEVDPATATDASNYTITGGETRIDPPVTAASLSDDKTTVTLTVADNGPADYVALENQGDYTLSVANVKAGDKVISQSDIAFQPVDATVPTVTKAEALGNKTIRVTFSEPVLPSTNSSSFTIDGVALVGNVVADGGSTVIVKTYSTMSDGAHKITIANVSDYSGLKNLSQTIDFQVVADTTAPTIDSIVSATYERIVVKFSEPIDPDTVSVSNFYYLSGTTKRYPTTVEKVSDDTFALNFSTYPLTYSTSLYVTGVKDYSGNTIVADSAITVSPVVDQTRPEVVSVTYDSGVITVKYSKALDVTSATTSSNYVIKDSDGNEVSKAKTIDIDSTNKIVSVKPGVALTQGKTYTLTISGVTDNTTLKNAIVPTTKQFTVGDSTPPYVSDVTYDSANNRLYVIYSEPVSPSDARNSANYYYTKDSGPNPSWSRFPDNTVFSLQSDSATVIISVPIAKLDVDDIKQVRVLAVKDLAGNPLNGGINDKAPVAVGNVTLSYAVATSKNTIKVTASRALLASTFNLSDFIVTNTQGTTLTVISGYISGSDIYLTLADTSNLTEAAEFNGYPIQVDVKASGVRTSTPDGVPLSQGFVAVNDKIPATIASVNGSTDGRTITVKFNEPILDLAGDGTNKEAADFRLIAADNTPMVAGATGKYGYTIEKTSNDTITIKFAEAQPDGGISVQVVSPQWLSDEHHQLVAASEVWEAAINRKSTTYSLATSPADNSATKLVVTFSQQLYKAADNSALTGTNVDVSTYFTLTSAGGSLVSATYNSTTNQVTFVLSGTLADGDKIDASGLENGYKDPVVASFKYSTTTSKWVKN